MAITRREVDRSRFNDDRDLPYELRVSDFQSAMQDVYDYFFDVNSGLTKRGFHRLEDTLRPANLSGTISDMMTTALATHTRVLVENQYHNGHPDLVVQGLYADNAVKAGEHGVEIKSTRKPGGAVDTHGAREQWMCVFVYRVDNDTEPAVERAALKFTEVYLGYVTLDDFRRNDRGELGTRTATLDRDGIAKLRQNWVCLDKD